MNKKRLNRDDVRQHTLCALLDEKEHKKAESVSRQMGISKSTLVRFALNEFYEKRGM